MVQQEMERDQYSCLFHELRTLNALCVWVKLAGQAKLKAIYWCLGKRLAINRLDSTLCAAEPDGENICLIGVKRGSPWQRASEARECSLVGDAGGFHDPHIWGTNPQSRARERGRERATHTHPDRERARDNKREIERAVQTSTRY